MLKYKVLSILFLSTLCFGGFFIGSSKGVSSIGNDLARNNQDSIYSYSDCYIELALFQEGSNVVALDDIVNNYSENFHLSDEVLICDSKSAYAYHSHYCQGLKRCKAEVIKMTKEEAIRIGRKPCGYCY
jgi:hypothetical protein